MSLNLEYIGYETAKVLSKIKEEEVSAYLDAINSKSNYYLEHSVAPSIYNVVLEIALVESIWKLQELHGSKEAMENNVLMLVHGEQKMTFTRLLKIGEEISSFASVENIQQKGSNNILRLKTSHFDSSNNEIGNSYWTLFIRASESEINKSKDTNKSEKPKKAPKPKVEENHDYILNTSFDISKDITYKYSKASKDMNPIHIDEEVAKKAGLAGIIVHGLCTMAMAIDNIIESFLNSDPERVDSVSLRFSSPVWPGDNLNVRGWLNKDDESLLNFEVENESKTKVIKSGSLSFKD